ncbi:34846_t:CDS:2, partial [Racocetra persica]
EIDNSKDDKNQTTASDDERFDLGSYYRDEISFEKDRHEILQESMNPNGSNDSEECCLLKSKVGKDQYKVYISDQKPVKEGLYNPGPCYQNDDYMVKNKLRASEWYEKGSKNKSSNSQNNLRLKKESESVFYHWLRPKIFDPGKEA